MLVVYWEMAATVALAESDQATMAAEEADVGQGGRDLSATMVHRAWGPKGLSACRKYIAVNSICLTSIA